VNFFSFFCSAEGLYEGTPLYPALFSNARDRISFDKSFHNYKKEYKNCNTHNYPSVIAKLFVIELQ